MANTPFDTFFKKAVEHEGKVCEDVPGDNGGPTKWGITIGRFCTSKGIKVPKRGSKAFETLKAELFALTEGEIKTFYRRDYWDAVRADELPPGINYAVADWGLNAGPSRAVKAAQKLCGNNQTGRMDDETLGEVSAYDPVEFIIMLSDERTRFYNAIVANRPKQRKFLNGWISRTGDVRRAAISMAGKITPQPTDTAAMPKAAGDDTHDAPPSVVKEAVKSKSNNLLVVMIGLVWAKIQGGMAWLAERIGDFADVAGETVSEVGDTIAPLKALAKLVQVNIDGVIWAGIVTAIAVCVLSRHTRDKVSLAFARLINKAN